MYEYGQLFTRGFYTEKKKINGNEVLSMLVLSTKKRWFSFWKKGFWFPENLFQSSKRPKSKVSR